MNWYPFFLFAVVTLWALSSPRDRNALRIVLIATVASFIITETVTRQIVGAWKLVVPGAVETLTILAMLHWSRNRTGYAQAALLSIAWVAHLLCYVDIALKTDLVYSRYEAILCLVAVGQLLACYDTFRLNLLALRRWLASLRGNSADAIPAASGCAAVLHHPRRPGV